MILEPSSESPALAREYCDGVLAAAGCQGRFVTDARLVVSELVTNAVLHARTRIELNLVLTTQALRIEVTDLGSGQPRRTHWDAGGRGLPIVDAIGEAWGIVEQGSGKTVWCELAL